MAITITKQAIVWSTTAGNKTTASFTPTANALLVVFSLHSATDLASTITDSLSGSWGQQGSLYSYSTSQAGTLGCYIRSTGVSGASMTVTSAPGATSTGGGLAVFEVTGAQGYGSTPVRGTGGQADQASGTPAPVLSATPNTTDGILSFIVDNTNGTANAVPRSSPAYSEDYDQGYNTPPSGIEANHINSGETSATITYGGTTPSQYGSYAIALKESVDTTVTPGTASLTTTLYTPTVTISNNIVVTPGTLALATTLLTPSAILGTVVVPGTLALTLTPYTPEVTVGGGGTTVIPGTASLVTTLFTPTVSISDNITVVPGVASLTLTLFTPTVTVSDNITVIPGVASLTITGYVPSIILGTVIIPGTSALILTLFTPTISVSQNVLVTPGLAIFNITPYTPSVLVLIYTSYGLPFLYESANWSGVSFYLEVNIRATTGTVYARLWDKTINAPVASSGLSTTNSAFQRLRSGALTLTNNDVYELQFGKISADAGEFQGGKLVVV